MTVRLLVCSLVLGVGVVSACGGAADTGLFGGGGGTVTDSGSGTSDSGGTHGDDSGTANDMDATTLPDASPGVDAVAPMDSATPVPDSSMPHDTIHCEGTAGCTPGAEVCCRRQNGPTSFSYACTQPQNCNGNGDLAIPCDTASQCATGEVCCMTVDAQNRASSVQCTLGVDCMQGATELCGPPMTSCPTGTCTVSTFTIPSYDFCK
jgi:hypothetical protein